jgi:hypothetical protein
MIESFLRSDVAPLALRIDVFALPAVEAMRLGLAFMHLELEGEFRQWVAGAQEMEQVRTAWQTLRDNPATTRALGMADEVETAVAECDEALSERDAARVVEAARRGKALAEALERLFA